jgi:arylsulfatase
VETLPRVFRSHGYTTAGFVSGPFLSSRYGFAQGFDLYDDYTLPQNARTASDRGATSPALTRLAIDWIDASKESAAEKPFFLFLHLWDVHYDYAPPSPYDRMFDPDYTGTVTGDDFLRNPAIRPDMDPRDLAHVVALYDGEIRFTDDHLGQIVAHLAALGLLDDTIVAVTADHGDEFFDHGRKGHGLSVYDEIILVPLVIRYPRRIAPARIVSEQVRLLDVGPTLLSLAGIRPPDDFGSRTPPGSRERERDLAPWLGGDADRASFPELVAIAESQMVFGSGTGGVRTRGRKLVEYNASHRLELYDLREDPGERRDRASEHPELVAHLATVRAAWARQFENGPALAKPILLDPDTTARLRAMGYVE